VVGHGLLSQFDELEFNETPCRSSTPEKVAKRPEISKAARRDECVRLSSTRWWVKR
jgi:hypothetical protein